ncbi:MAG: AhpC/TSA family protein [Candidatus Accumulibacter sp.]|jgi:peroxiredoxin|nr:AhpC/TSA family protein [Accumulibacter sp.]
MPRLRAGENGIDFTFDTPWEKEKRFLAENAGRRSIVFFLRYYGCTACQLELHDLRREYHRFAATGAALYVVLQSEAETIREQADARDIPFTLILDPRQKLYASFQIGSRDPGTERGREHLAKMLRAAELGLSHGKFEGNEYQLPAVFIFDEKNKVLLAHYGKETSDIPPYDDLLKILES